ncbi:DUF1883 domain-containing protein [Nocardioides sp. WV_118_6]
MQFQQYDLGNVKKGSRVIVTLKNQANVRLMTQSEFNKYRRGGAHRYIGGLVKRSPWSGVVPSTGHWYVAIDLGGYSGRVQSSVRVEGPPPGFLPTARDAADRPLRDIEVREPQEPVGDVLGGQTWDVFISHASEDKEAVALPLRNALAELGVTVWLDKTELRLGDSLRRKIDQGIRSSRFSVVVLSEQFFAKGWTNHELDGLVTRTVAGEQTMLPIWHNLTGEQVRGYSPSLADKLALNTSSLSVDEMAEAIAAVVKGDDVHAE